MDYILEVENLTKEFPGVVALDRVKLQVKKGEVHAVVGENGAGKSTLMKILGGQYTSDNGRIFLKGEEIKIASIEASLKLGISVIYQEFNLVPELSVAEKAESGYQAGSAHERPLGFTAADGGGRKGDVV